MSTYSSNGTDWFPASVEQVSYMEQARLYFETSRFIFDNGQIQIIPMTNKDTYILLYPDDTYAYLSYKSTSKKDKLNFIRENIRRDILNKPDSSVSSVSSIKVESNSSTVPSVNVAEPSSSTEFTEDLGLGHDYDIESQNVSIILQHDDIETLDD